MPVRKSANNQSVTTAGEPFDLAGEEGHLVQAGECLHAIAESRGFTWETLWNLPENEPLKQAKRAPHLLHPGDRVFVPDPRPKEVEGGAEARHRFKRVGIPNKLRVQIFDDGQPLKNLGFEIDFGGEVQRGTSDGEGVVETFIPKGAQSARLKIGEGARQKAYELDLGELAPTEGISGVQARLNNLGYDAGEVDGYLGPNTRDALRRFQLKQALKETGEPDDETVKKLIELHGS